MGNEPLANLVRTGGLKAEPADKNEYRTGPLGP